MVCGTDKSKFGEVWIKNVVYREVFESHSQIEPIEDIDEICSLLNETFPSSQLTITLLPEAIAPAKRESVPNISDSKGKIIKLHEFNANTISPLGVVDNMNIAEFIVSPLSDPEYIFDAII